MDDWQWPQWVAAIWMLMGLMAAAARHGQPRKAPWSFPVQIVGVAVTAVVLWKGGFWL